MWSSARSEAALEAQLPLPIDIRPMRQARRMRLRLDDSRGRLKLTCPIRTSRKTALTWALEQRAWIDAQMERLGDRLLIEDGSLIAVEGRDRLIRWKPDWPRQPQLDVDEIRCGGPPAGLERRVIAFLKSHALAVMSSDVAEFSRIAGVAARSVGIGDAASRWGSCSSDQRIRLSWRLILAPPEVRRYVVAHEVAHLRHLDHGSDFKALERRLVGPGLSSARKALKDLGPRLRRVGRGSL